MNVNQAHPAHIPFKALRDACINRGMSVRMQIFEGGETVIVRDSSNKDLLSVTREYGDSENACAAAMQWLIENDYISSGDTDIADMGKAST